MDETDRVLFNRWYIPDPVFGIGAAVYAGEDPNTAALVCDCSMIDDLDLWDGDPLRLAHHICNLHNDWLTKVEQTGNPD
jgi:hypothetical protein